MPPHRCCWPPPQLYSCPTVIEPGHVACRLATSREGHQAMKRLIKTLVLTGAAAIVLAPMQARPTVGLFRGSARRSAATSSNGQTTLRRERRCDGRRHRRRRSGLRMEPELLRRPRATSATTRVMNLMGNVIVGVPIGGHARRRRASLRRSAASASSGRRSTAAQSRRLHPSSSTTCSAGTRARA